MEIWFQIFKYFELDCFLSFHEVLSESCHYSLLKEFVESRVPEELYNFMMKGRKQLRLSLRSSKDFEIGLRKPKTKNGRKHRCYQSNPTGDLCIPENAEGIEFSYSAQGSRRAVLMEYRPQEFAGEEPGITTAELHLFLRANLKLIFHYKGRRGSEPLNNVNGPRSFSSSLELEKVEADCRWTRWSYSGITERWVEQLGFNLCQVTAVAAFGVNNAPSDSRWSLDRRDFFGWPEIDWRNLGVPLIEAGISFRKCRFLRYAKMLEGASNEAAWDEKIWTDMNS
jgi:hypothetical protein